MDLDKNKRDKVQKLNDKIYNKYLETLTRLRDNPNKKKLQKFLIKMMPEYDFEDENGILTKKDIKKMEVDGLLEIFEMVLKDAQVWIDKK